MRHWTLEMKVGLYAVGILLLIAFATLRVSEGPMLFGGGYDITVLVDSAGGIDEKTPVEIAGIRVGHVKSVQLAGDGRRADVVINIDRDDVRLPGDTKVVARARGFLGDTYLELIPGASPEMAKSGDALGYGGAGGDINLLVTRFNEVADDIKVVSSSLRDMIGGEDAPVRRTINDMSHFAKTMRELVEQNQRNVNEITDNFAVMSEQLRSAVAESRRDAVDAVSNIASISRKIDEGQGTVGRLINDEATVDKVNETLDALSGTLGGFQRLETDIGYHTEYLTSSSDFKHYIHFNLWPRPDEAFLLEFVEDRSPSANRVTRVTDITPAGGATTTITTNTQTIERNRFRVSAQLAKRLYDFTLRGGIIESRGGVGFDYDKGPVRVSASAFDFNTQDGNKPHLKFAGQVNVTPALYVMGGADDPLNPNQSTDWFVGAGVRVRDEDIKSLLSAGGLSSALGR